MKTYLFLADGFEEIEALSVVDIFRRGKQELLMVSISDSLSVVGAHGIKVEADILFKEVEPEDALLLVFPGGMPGTKHLAECKPLVELMQRHFDEGRLIAAICAAPAMMLGQLKGAKKLEITCYPGFESYAKGAQISDEGVVIDGNVTTAKGAGLAVDFALTLISQIASPELAEEIAESIQI